MTRSQRVAIGTLCTLVLLVLPGWVLRHERVTHVEEREAALARVENRNATLRAENARLHDAVTTLAEDSERLEFEVRERLGWITPNEVVISFATPESP